MGKSTLLILGGLVAAAAVAAWSLGLDPVTRTAVVEAIQSPSGPIAREYGDSTTSDLEQYALALDSLSEVVEHEITERLYLEEQIRDLEAQLARLESQLSGEEAEQNVPTSNRPTSRGRSADITVDSFVQAGFSVAEAEFLKKQRDEAAMARLYLRDRAIREGWYRTERYFAELRQLPDSLGQLREQMDETSYDRYLYAVGQPNRVSVISVMDNSAAQNAGLQSGDIIYRYDGERLFSTNSLLSASRQGEFGEVIPIEVQRDDQRMTLYVPRGPLGVRMNSFSSSP